MPPLLYGPSYVQNRTYYRSRRNRRRSYRGREIKSYEKVEISEAKEEGCQRGLQKIAVGYDLEESDPRDHQCRRTRRVGHPHNSRTVSRPSRPIQQEILCKTSWGYRQTQKSIKETRLR